MFKHTPLAGALLAASLTLPWAAPARAHTVPSDLDALRAEIQAMKQHYEARLAELEARLKAAEARPVPVPAQPPAEPATSRASAFNPEISLIVQGRYAHRDDIPERHLTGFMSAGGHDHGTERGFSVDHTELVLSANVDPYWRGYANVALLDEEVEVEETWFQSLGLGHGLSVKGGRFYSGLGYLNERHPHAWDFVDAPLMYQALFGERFSNDGLQLKWLAPTETYLEFGVEAGNGRNFPGSGDSGNAVGAWTGFAKIGGDLGESHSWRAGLAMLYARPEGRESHWEDINGDEVATTFNGTSRSWIADFVWKWAPNGNPKVRNFTFQAEWFQRDEDGDLSCDDADPAVPTACTGGSSGDYDTRQTGWYAQGVYQFMPRWRVGARYDRLDSGSLDFGANDANLDDPDDDPSRYSLMLDWSPSEFSRLRLQYARDESMEGISEDQWTLQYIMSLGAHGAHQF